MPDLRRRASDWAFLCRDGFDDERRWTPASGVSRCPSIVRGAGSGISAAVRAVVKLLSTRLHVMKGVEVKERSLVRYLREGITVRNRIDKEGRHTWLVTHSRSEVLKPNGR